MELDGKVVAADFTRRIRALELTWDEICRRAVIARSTPPRWANGMKPQEEKYNRVERVLRRLERRVEKVAAE